MRQIAPRATPQLTVPEIKTKLTELGVSRAALARAAGIHEPNISAVLNGHQYLGSRRAARLSDALHQLAVELAAKQAAQEQEQKGEPAADTPVAPVARKRLPISRL